MVKSWCIVVVGHPAYTVGVTICPKLHSALYYTIFQYSAVMQYSEVMQYSVVMQYSAVMQYSTV